MAIVTTSLGDNSSEISYENGDSLAGVMTAIETYITNHGWAVYDASAGTNAVCYRALNKDGNTYKYVVLDYNTSGYVKLIPYESWNSSTHVGTNIAFGSNSSTYTSHADYNQKIDLTGSNSIIVFANARWLGLFSNIGGTFGSTNGNGATFCLEHKRMIAEDIADESYPTHCWINTYLFWTLDTNLSRFKLGWCRTKELGTAIIDCFWNAGHIVGGRYIGQLIQNQFYNVQGVNTWNNKPYNNNIMAFEKANLKGLLFGFKALQQTTGATGDNAIIAVDADYFSVESGGTDKGHYIFYQKENSLNYYWCFCIPS